MLGYDRRGVGMVVLDAVEGQSQTRGIVAAHIVRVQITDSDHRLDLEDLFQVLDRFGIKFKGFKVEKISNMLARIGQPVSAKTKGALQSSSAADNRRQ